MQEAKYLLDCYTHSFDAHVVSVKDGKFVVLDSTYFYPNGGGQPYDTGKMVSGGEEFPVVFVGKFDGVVSHEVAKPGLKAGDRVHCAIDWERRYKHMRMHTAAHILSNVIEKSAGALITGNQLGLEQSRIDFSLDNFDRGKMMEYAESANKIIREAHKINLYLLPREEAEVRVKKLTTLAKGFSDEIKEVRLVEIEGFVTEACGGTHLKNTGEVKGLRIVKIDNKGAKNRRVYFELAE
jgi:misacylated tRNA(Ala) deacylase